MNMDKYKFLGKGGVNKKSVNGMKNLHVPLGLVLEESEPNNIFLRFNYEKLDDTCINDDIFDELFSLVSRDRERTK
jgi:hypothetical protein